MRLYRFAWLLAGLIALGVMALLAFTPIVWIRSGRESETYPELLYFGLGLPMALIATVAGGIDAKLSLSRSKAALIPLRATALSAVLTCAWLVWVGLGPKIPALEHFSGPAFGALFSVGLPILVIALLVSVRPATQRPKANTDADRSRLSRPH